MNARVPKAIQHIELARGNGEKNPRSSLVAGGVPQRLCSSFCFGIEAANQAAAIARGTRMSA